MAKTVNATTLNPKTQNGLTIPKPTISHVKKVLILGAECTGKSTLTQDLGTYFHAPIVNEFMRTYLAKTEGLCVSMGGFITNCDWTNNW